MFLNLQSGGGMGLRHNPLVRLLSSIRLGVTLLFLIVLYASIMSALPQVRGAVELTEMEAFQHWVFVALVALFTLSLCAATWFRIRWSLLNLGVLTVHAGLLLLTLGSVWYFAGKVEGDVVLRVPRIELLSTAAGSERVVADFPAQKGQTWGSFMPAFGGEVRLAVMDCDGADGLRAPRSATVVASLGDSPARTVELTANRPAAELTDRLRLRLVTFPPERHFYDRDRAALHYRKAGSSERRVVPIDGLPAFRERYVDEGEVLRDRSGRPVPSKRTRPELQVLGLRIPTGWFEHWRMPIALETADLPFDVRVTGYLPYVGATERILAEGGPVENPGAQIELKAGSASISEPLLALDPARSLLATRLPVEFRWVADEAERDQLFRPLSGPHELYVEVLDPPVRQTLAVAQGQTIRVEGTPYELTIRQLAPDWPLMTPGFEGARSPMASVDVVSGSKRYNRTVIQRYPQLSQDIDEQGTRHREGPYDPNLILRYRTSAEGWLMLTAGPDLQPVMGVFDADGSVKPVPLAVGQPSELDVAGGHLHVTLKALYRHAREIARPVVEPLETRRPNLGRSPSAIRLTLTGRGPHADWSESHWVMFSPYPHIESQPARVRVPWDDAEWELIYSRVEHELGGLIGNARLTVNFFPGQLSAETWRSDFFVQPEGQPAPARAAVYTNQTARMGDWTLFQSTAASDHWRWTGLGVGNRKGIWPMVLGSTMIPLGCLYAFYVKPILKRSRAAGPAQGARRGKLDGRRAVAVPPTTVGVS